jgi:hypothetical protein
MGRYTGTKQFRNGSKNFSYLRKNRKIKVANHYETPRLRNPSIEERASIITDKHVWSLGDRYYKLADQYYGSAEYWWVIAWYNARPLEADLRYGDLLMIPINLQSILDMLGLQY